MIKMTLTRLYLYMLYLFTKNLTFYSFFSYVVDSLHLTVHQPSAILFVYYAQRSPRLYFWFFALLHIK